MLIILLALTAIALYAARRYDLAVAGDYLLASADRKLWGTVCAAAVVSCCVGVFAW